MDLPLLIVLMGLILAISALVLFVVLVIAIRMEDRRRTLNTTPGDAVILSRRLLGTYAHHCPRSTTLCSGRR